MGRPRVKTIDDSQVEPAVKSQKVRKIKNSSKNERVKVDEASRLSEEGEIRLAGYGTSAKQVAGILAQARVIAAFGNKGGSAGLAVGAFMGPTGEFPLGATSVFGYSRGTAKGIGAAATVSVEIYLDSAVREGVVSGVNHVVDHITGKQEGQSSPSQQSPAQQSPAQQSPAQQK